MRFFMLYILLVALAFGSTVSLSDLKSEKRIAYVIGNYKYAHSPLPSKHADALKMKEFLEANHFKVVYKENVNKREMVRGIREFHDAIEDNGIVLFYYYGRSYHYNNKNYLIPIKSTVENKKQLTSNAVSLDALLSNMGLNNNRLNIVVIDSAFKEKNQPAFLNNPKGLSGIDAGNNVDIFLAAKPNTYRQSSSFTQKFIFAASKKGTSNANLSALLKKSVQNSYSKLSNKTFFFNTPNKLFDEDTQAWKKAELAGTVAAISSYLATHQHGKYFEQAISKIQEFTIENMKEKEKIKQKEELEKAKKEQKEKEEKAKKEAAIIAAYLAKQKEIEKKREEEKLKQEAILKAQQEKEEKARLAAEELKRQEKQLAEAALAEKIRTLRKETRYNVENPRSVVVQCDTLFFGKSSKKFGILVFKDAKTHKTLIWKHIQRESVSDYQFLKDELERNGFTIEMMIVNGKRDLAKAFSDTPVQVNLHDQTMIIQRYLTRKPKSNAGKELKAIVAILETAKEDEFRHILDVWYQKNRSSLASNRRLKASYESIQANLLYLFTYKKSSKQYLDSTKELSVDIFKELKPFAKEYQHKTKEEQLKYIDEYLKNS